MSLELILTAYGIADLENVCVKSKKYFVVWLSRVLFLVYSLFTTFRIVRGLILNSRHATNLWITTSWDYKDTLVVISYLWFLYKIKELNQIKNEINGIISIVSTKARHSIERCELILSILWYSLFLVLNALLIGFAIDFYFTKVRNQDTGRQALDLEVIITNHVNMCVFCGFQLVCYFWFVQIWFLVSTAERALLPSNTHTNINSGLARMRGDISKMRMREGSGKIRMREESTQERMRSETALGRMRDIECFAESRDLTETFEFLTRLAQLRVQTNSVMGCIPFINVSEIFLGICTRAVTFILFAKEGFIYYIWIEFICLIVVNVGLILFVHHTSHSKEELWIRLQNFVKRKPEFCVLKREIAVSVKNNALDSTTLESIARIERLLSTYPTSISAMDLFDINRSLLLTFLAAVVPFTVMLIQLIQANAAILISNQSN